MARQKKTYEQFNREVFKLVGNEYTILDKYIDSNTKILVRHNSDKCNCNEYMVEPRKFLENRRCPICSNINRFDKLYKDGIFKPILTHAEFCKKVYELVSDEYTVLGEYVKNDIKVLMRHNKCGNIWGVRPDNFTSMDRRCPYCNESKGIERIVKWLKSNNIYYNIEYIFEDLKGTGNGFLRYDIAIFKDIEKYILQELIEYDGEQHFKPIKFFGGEEKFKTQKIHDKLKNDYCITNNIKLTRIPYWDFDNIEKILDKSKICS